MIFGKNLFKQLQHVQAGQLVGSGTLKSEIRIPARERIIILTKKVIKRLNKIRYHTI